LIRFHWIYTIICVNWAYLPRPLRGWGGCHIVDSLKGEADIRDNGCVYAIPRNDQKPPNFTVFGANVFDR